MTTSLIFDLDGLLIDSEPWWQAAQGEVFTSLGVPLTAELAASMVGRRVRDHVSHWYAAYPWQGPTLREVEAEIVSRALGLILQHAKPLPGAVELVRKLSDRGLTLAVASSSPLPVIEAILERLMVRSRFHIVQSAEHEPFGKPHPGVYLTTAKRLGVSPSDCLALEDSFNGLLAARAAGMACVAVPAPNRLNDPRFDIADAVIPSLEWFSDVLIRRLLPGVVEKGRASAPPFSYPVAQP